MTADLDGTGHCLVVKVTHTEADTHWKKESMLVYFKINNLLLSLYVRLNFLSLCVCTRVYVLSSAPCGSRSTGSEGTVLSPNFPRNYTSGHTCVYSISVPREFGKFIHIHSITNTLHYRCIQKDFLWQNTLWFNSIIYTCMCELSLLQWKLQYKVDVIKIIYSLFLKRF